MRWSKFEQKNTTTKWVHSLPLPWCPSKMADVYTWAPNIPSVNRPAIRLYPEINSHLCLYCFIKSLCWLFCAVFVFKRSDRFDTIVYSDRCFSAYLRRHLALCSRTAVYINTGSTLGLLHLFRRRLCSFTLDFIASFVLNTVLFSGFVFWSV